MTKQEEIREKLREHILIAIEWADKEGMTDAYLALHVEELERELGKLGVVIKVDRELSGCGCEICDADNDVSRTLVEPLIETP